MILITNNTKTTNEHVGQRARPKIISSLAPLPINSLSYCIPIDAFATDPLDRSHI